MSLSDTLNWGTPIGIPSPEQQAHLNVAMREHLDLVKPNALSKQVGGQHYKDRAIQPVEYIHANKVGYFEGNVIKYVTRWRDKNGLADLEKAKHYIELLIELETANAGQQKAPAPDTQAA